VELVVGSSVLKIITQAAPNDESAVFVDRHVATVKKAMDVRTKGKPVRNKVLSSTRVGDYVRCVENWKRVFLGNCAGAVVRVEHADSKDPLAEPR
jgi:hypothetical protein